MLELFFRSGRVPQWYRSGVTAPYIDGFAGALHAAGYRHYTVCTYLRATVHLGLWMERERLGLRSLGGGMLSSFLKHIPTCQCFENRIHGRKCAGPGVRRFVAYLRDQSVIPPPAHAPTRDPPVLLTSFEDWMRQYRGVTESTLVAYRGAVMELLATLGDDPSRYQAGDLRSFIMKRAPRHGREFARMTVTSIRSFLRFLATQQICEPCLVDAIPTIAQWRLSSLPSYLPEDDVERLILACDTATDVGLRDRAILLLLARIGLRAGDVSGLRLGDIDWSKATVRVSGKSKRTCRLPLPQDVGNAILAYLHRGRPDVADDHVFIRACAPLIPFSRSSTVSYIVNRAAARAGVELPRTGAHVLRHSLATSLLRRGASLQTIGAVLRHRGPDTTAIYAKVDVSTLKEIAQPWPVEVFSC